MAFDDLPPQSPINEKADAYAARALALSRAAAETTRCVLDIAYGDDYWQKLDVYLPEDRAASGLPVLIFLHGGGWTHGYKEWMGFMAPAVVGLPAIFVSASYRLAPGTAFPDMLDDCFAALAWVHGTIARHGGDPRRIFIGGHSAGGHLAALVALRRDLAARRNLPSDVIKGCFPVSTPFILGEGEPDRPERVTGEVLLRSGVDAAELSPISHVAGNTTPFYISWGGAERPVFERDGRAMIAALEAQPGRVESEVFPGLDHFQANLDQGRADGPWARTALSWMATIGAPAPAG